MSYLQVTETIDKDQESQDDASGLSYTTDNQLLQQTTDNNRLPSGHQLIAQKRWLRTRKRQLSVRI